MAPPTPRAKPSGRSTAEDLKEGEFAAQRPREAGLTGSAPLTRKKPAGGILFAAEVGRGDCGI